MLMCELDGTPNKAKLGANAILGVSMAACRAGAAADGVPLYQFLNKLAGSPAMVMPVPCFNCINGGVHGGNYLPFQEFFLIPIGAPNFKEAMRYGSETYHTMKGIIKEKYGLDSTAVGDEGGFAPKIESPEDALKLLVEAIDKAGYNGKIVIGSDPAASETFDKKLGKYNLDFKKPAAEQDPKNLKTGPQLVDWWVDLAKRYPVYLLEDPCDENDFDSHASLTAKYFWGPVCGAAALLIIFIIVMIELYICRRKAAGGGDEGGEGGEAAAEGGEAAAGGEGEAAEELVAVAVEAAVEAAPPVALVESAAVKADLGSMEKIVHGEKNDTMTLGIGSMGGSLDECDDLMDDEDIWNEDGSFVVKPKYQAPKKQDLGPIELAPKAGEV